MDFIHAHQWDIGGAVIIATIGYLVWAQRKAVAHMAWLRVMANAYADQMLAAQRSRVVRRTAQTQANRAKRKKARKQTRDSRRRNRK